MDELAQPAQVVWVGPRACLLEALSEHGNMSRACRETALARRTVYAWMDAEPDFAQAVEKARDSGLRGMYDCAIDHLYRTIEDEESKATPESIRVALKVVGSVRPQTWGEKSQVEHTGATIHEVRHVIIRD